MELATRSVFYCTTPVNKETDWKPPRRCGKFASLPNQLIHRLAELAPRLQPELLHRVISAYGLEDCAELVAQATPAQLSHVFDLDLWRPPGPGLDEQFDAERFGVWIESWWRPAPGSRPTSSRRCRSSS